MIVQADTFVSHGCDIDYHDGERYPVLERVDGTPDYLDDITKPLTTPEKAQGKTRTSRSKHGIREQGKAMKRFWSNLVYQEKLWIQCVMLLRVLSLPLLVPFPLVGVYYAQQSAPAASAEEYSSGPTTPNMNTGSRCATESGCLRRSMCRRIAEDRGPYPFLMDRTPYSVAPYGEDHYPGAPGPVGRV